MYLVREPGMIARFRGLWMLAILAGLAVVAPAGAESIRPVLRDNFGIGGTGTGAVCEAQSRIGGPAVSGIFDRTWSVVCRDADVPVGQIFALRRGGPAIAPRVAAARGQAVECDQPKDAMLPDIGKAAIQDCRVTANGLAYRIVAVEHGRFSYVAQGLAAYASALDLALRSIVVDRIIPGTVNVATLGSGDAVAFARLQARTADARTVLSEGYRSNNAGRYAEAAAFFGALQDVLYDSGGSGAEQQRVEHINAQHEALVNRALQRSNLGQFDEADALFVQATALPTRDPVQLRLRRNFMAIHRLNQGDFPGARTVLDAPVASAGEAPAVDGSAFVVTPGVAAAINSAQGGAGVALIRQDTSLSPAERVAILDAQSFALRGVSLRLEGKPGDAHADLARAIAAIVAIRDGRVVSLTRLHAQALIELARVDEAQGQFDAAAREFRGAADLIEAQYPETAALNGARAQYAAFLARRGRHDEAMALYRQIVANTVASQSDLTGVANQLEPYFALLAADVPQHPEHADDLFLAAQTILRPGAASTLDQLARALSGGGSDGARLFRQSLSLSRDIERSRIAIGQMRAQMRAAPGADAAAIAGEETNLANLQAEKTATLAKLTAFPQFRAVDKAVITLADLRAVLHPGEAYFKLTQVGEALYAVYVDGAGATGYRLAVDGATMGRMVGNIRDSISIVINGVQATYPFDVTDARALYIALFGPVSDRLAGVRHLIFEPDGAMLELPVNLLIADQRGADHYLASLDKDGSDEFDFRGIDWLGRDHGVSTALSARSFKASRETPPAAGRFDYIGFGENAPPPSVVTAAFNTGLRGDNQIDCRWPMRAWGRPISAAELHEAARALHDPGAVVVTGNDFTDQSVLARGDLDQFHIVHFATHGLVAAPRSGCPAEPALLTSFGATGSDGLLDFAEIFRLKLDADLVILSACDTAAGASRSATLAAGLDSGGGAALDGLVRAFIGAGGRAVIASHWPAPDQFDATRQLFNGLFAAPPGTTTADAMRAAEIRLMDSATTSHPFYWSGFAIIGDGDRAIESSAPAAKGAAS